MQDKKQFYSEHLQMNGFCIGRSGIIMGIINYVKLKKMGVTADVDSLKIPRHIAIIMDGNGRWAKKRHRPRTYGHAKGARVLEDTLENCDALGVDYLTVYAFSTENWARPFEEVQVIMNLFRQYLVNSVEKCMKNNVRCFVIGERSKLSEDIIQAINNLEDTTRNNTGITFIIAINYGSRDEIVRSFRKLSEKVKNGDIDAEDITAQDISGCLDTAGVPDPDLLIRTSGEERLSNFLLWQLAYAEFYFTDALWPEFDIHELIKAIRVYTSRDRRYGQVK